MQPLEYPEELIHIFHVKPYAVVFDEKYELTSLIVPPDLDFSPGTCTTRLAWISTEHYLPK